MLSRQKALEIVTKNIPNKNLVKHCLCVEAAMKGLYEHLTPQDKQNETDKELWGTIGLLHDADWEATRDSIDQHTRKTVEWLKEAGETDETVFRTILSHNYLNVGVDMPANQLEWALYTCDELTGFIVASALVTPEKKLAHVTVDSVIKKMNSKSFAAAVDRTQIRLCEEKLGIPLPEFIEIILKSMQGISEELGL